MKWGAFRKVGDCKPATDSVVCPPTHRVLTPPPHADTTTIFEDGAFKEIGKDGRNHESGSRMTDVYKRGL